MTEPEILQKAIEKSQKNGWMNDHVLRFVASYDGSRSDYNLHFIFDDDGTAETWSRDWQTIIFSHDFAKAFWGEDAWQIRLQQQVLEKEPIKYLEKFL